MTPIPDTTPERPGEGDPAASTGALEIIAAHLPQGYGIHGWLCRCAENSDGINWRDEQDYIAHISAQRGTR